MDPTRHPPGLCFLIFFSIILFRYVFILRCIAYPFTVALPQDPVRRYLKVTREYLNVLRERFTVSFCFTNKIIMNCVYSRDKISVFAWENSPRSNGCRYICRLQHEWPTLSYFLILLRFLTYWVLAVSLECKLNTVRFKKRLYSENRREKPPINLWYPCLQFPLFKLLWNSDAQPDK